jgi:hypothetical protein
LGVVSAPGRERDVDEDDIEDEEGYDRSQFDEDGHDEGELEHATPREQPFRPFADLPPLPADVNDAFEAYKLCILRHRLAGWQEISRDDMVGSLAALQQLALAPADA